MAGVKKIIITSYASDINKLCLFENFVRSKYLPYVQKNKRSWKTDDRYLNRYILPYLGALSLTQISEENLRAWLFILENNGLAPSSRYRLFCLVRYILNLAVRWKVISDNIGFECQRRPAFRTETLNAEEKKKLLESLRQLSAHVSAHTIHLRFLMGASKSEILYDRRRDVNFAQHALVTRHTPSGKMHRIYLSNETVSLIRTFPRRAGVPRIFFHARSGNRGMSLFAFRNKLRNALGRPTLCHALVYSPIQEGLSYEDVRNRLGHYSAEFFQLQSALLGQHSLVSGGFCA